MFLAVEHDADDIESCFVTIAAACERDLRPGHDQRDGDIKLVHLEAKIRGAEIQRQICRGKLGGELLLELQFLVFFCGMLVVRWSVVTTAVVDLHSGNVHLYCDTSVPPIPGRIGAAI